MSSSSSKYFDDVQLIYRITPAVKSGPDCTVEFTFIKNTVKVKVEDHHSGEGLGHSIGFSITYDKEKGYVTRIKDFVVPIKGKGIGTLIFHEVYNNLPMAEKSRWWISGELSCTDVGNDGGDKRNRFWRRIIDAPLVQIDTRPLASRLEVDEQGVGEFSGYVSYERIRSHPTMFINKVSASPAH